MLRYGFFEKLNRKLRNSLFHLQSIPFPFYTMKLILIILVSFFSSTLLSQIINVPDTNFKKALIEHGKSITGYKISIIDTNNDGEIQLNEAVSYNGAIKIVKKEIRNLKGIELFKNIIQLDCMSNIITSIDLSKNKKLQYISCYDNKIVSLNISENTELISLACHGNLIENIDISNNLKLEELSFSFNKITKIDVSKNTELQYFYCDYNPLKSVDLSQNKKLVSCTFSNTELESLNIANGNNNEIWEVYAENIPKLKCIQHDSGFNPTDNGWVKSEGISWSINCSN